MMSFQCESSSKTIKQSFKVVISLQKLLPKSANHCAATLLKGRDGFDSHHPLQLLRAEKLSFLSFFVVFENLLSQNVQLAHFR